MTFDTVTLFFAADLVRLLWGGRREEEVKLHEASDAHSSIVLFDEGGMQATTLSDLLLYKVISEASYLEIVLYCRIDRDDS